MRIKNGFHNSKIPQGVMTDVLQVMNELNLEEDFPVDKITILKLHDENWLISCGVKTVNPSGCQRTCS